MSVHDELPFDYSQHSDNFDNHISISGDMAANQVLTEIQGLLAEWQPATMLSLCAGMSFSEIKLAIELGSIQTLILVDKHKAHLPSQSQLSTRKIPESVRVQTVPMKYQEYLLSSFQMGVTYDIITFFGGEYLLKTFETFAELLLLSSNVLNEGGLLVFFPLQQSEEVVTLLSERNGFEIIEFMENGAVILRKVSNNSTPVDEPSPSPTLSATAQQ